jgi:CTP synthase
VIATMAEQVDIIDHGDMGGTMRLGLYEAELAEGRWRPRCTAPSGERASPPPLRGQQPLPRSDRRRRPVVLGAVARPRLVEYVELPRDVHPYYIATQAHPELRSRPTEANPLFRGLIAAALERHRSSELFEVEGDVTDGGGSRCRRGGRGRGRPQRDAVRRTVWNIRRDEVAYNGRPSSGTWITPARWRCSRSTNDRVLLIKQYRHPVRLRDWEIPAGLLDIGGESPLVAAQRELPRRRTCRGILARAGEFMTSPGGSDETIRIYLARDLRAADETFAGRRKKPTSRCGGCRWTRSSTPCSRAACRIRHWSSGRSPPTRRARGTGRRWLRATPPGRGGHGASARTDPATRGDGIGERRSGDDGGDSSVRSTRTCVTSRSSAAFEHDRGVPARSRRLSRVARRRRRRGHIDITPAVVAQFAAERAAADPPPAATSLARLQSSVRGLHRFLCGRIELRRERSPDPAEDPQRLPKALTIDQIARSWMPPAPRPAPPPRPMRSAFATAL